MHWRKYRETYNILASLTHDFDEFLSPVILLSFGHNLYFICLQLLNSLKCVKYFLYVLLRLITIFLDPCTVLGKLCVLPFYLHI